MISYRPAQISDEHLRRDAGVYIRQSSLAQVRDNIGSALIQRDLVAVPLGWGWPQERIELRDDLGSSADEPGSRDEFERLIRDMAAGRLGAIFITEFSRLGRNELDQALFMQTARLYNVLLVVDRTVYDFRDPNSAFTANLLGFGAVREHRMRIGQGREARRRKAEHGLEPTAPPIGFTRTQTGLYAKTNDDRIREAIQLVWDTFFRLRSGRKVVRYLREHGIQLPCRVFHGVAWRDATWSTAIGILKNPVYGGIYIYGRTRVVEHADGSLRVRKRQVSVPRSEWIVKEGLHVGYVTPAQFREVQEILASNRVVRRRPAGQGRSLLQGLVRCARHDKTLFTIYDRRERRADDGIVWRPARYLCDPGILTTGRHEHCCSIAARRLDPLVEAVMLDRLGPATIDEINESFQDDSRHYEALGRAREDELRRAERSAAELERDYLTTDAEHRHVKDRLRTLWEEARTKVDDLKAKATLEPIAAPERLAQEEMDELRLLLGDLRELWRHPAVTHLQRKTIVRLLVKHVVFEARERDFGVTVHWAAGDHESLTAPNAAGARALAEQWHRDKRTSAEIATGLTQAGAASLPGKKGYSVMATRGLICRIRKENRFTEQAFRFIHAQVLDGQRYRDIVRGLIAAGIPHSGGGWAQYMVRNAVARMRRVSVYGLPALPPRLRLRDEVRRLALGNLDATAILARLTEAGVLTIHRRNPRLVTVKLLLRQLGLEASRPHNMNPQQQSLALAVSNSIGTKRKARSRAHSTASTRSSQEP